MRNILKLALAVLLLAPAAASARDLEIYFIDVMGGAATLVVTPERESVLIDTGWPGHDDRDPKRIAHVIKDVAGLDHLDHLVTTHWHVDHYGGVAGLAKLVRIDHFWDHGLPTDNLSGVDFPEGPKADDPLLVAYLEAAGGKRKPLSAGDRLPLSGVEALVLASGGRVIDAPAGASANPLCDDAPDDKPVDNSDNARSVVLRFRLGEFTFLDCGDLTWNVEKKLVCPVDLIGSVDVYQVTHHGLDISNHPILLKTIAPTISVMNNGARKGGSAETVKRLKSIPSIQAAYQLHKNSTTSDDENTDPKLIANSDPEGGEFVQIRVEPDGSAFSVRIGEKGEAKTFESR